ncbi:MAG: hypothetical protein ACK4FV_03805 [Candidatus Nitrosocaldus sp.]
MNEESSGPLTATRYGRAAAQLVDIIYKNIIKVVYVTIALAVFGLLDVFGILHMLRLYSEATHDLIVAAISILLLLILSYIFLYIIKARSILNAWMKQLESSSMNVSIRVLAKSKSKEDIIHAIAESVSEVSSYLYEYIENDDLSRFIDVKIDNERFDILIDRDRVEEGKFKDVLKEYGSIVAMVVDGVADRGKIDEFYNKLIVYNRITGNRIGLALLIADRVEAEAKVFVRHKAIESLLLIEQSTE